MPPITRLIEHIDGIDMPFVAQCLGVDPTRYKVIAKATVEDDDQKNEPVIMSASIKADNAEERKALAKKVLFVKCLNKECSIFMKEQEFFPIYHKQKQQQQISSLVCTQVSLLINNPCSVKTSTTSLI